jgi:hypothetical protein
LPVTRSSTTTQPFIVWNTTRLPTTAGEDAIFPPGVSRRHITLPKRIEIARTVAWALPMYATPSSTTAGNSIRVPMPSVQTVRKGGRSRMCDCTCARDGVAPYSGHCIAGWYTRIVARRRPNRSCTTRRVKPEALIVTSSGRSRGTRTSATPSRVVRALLPQTLTVAPRTRVLRSPSTIVSLRRTPCGFGGAGAGFGAGGGAAWRA